MRLYKRREQTERFLRSALFMRRIISRAISVDKTSKDIVKAVAQYLQYNRLATCEVEEG